MKVDTLIVGFGIAGLNYAEQLRRQNKSFVVLTQDDHSASHIAAGIVNPIVLKRFNPIWKAKEFLDYALPFYFNLEEWLQTQIIHQLPIYRILNDIQEQNNWSIAASRTSLEKYLNKQLIPKDKFPEVSAPFAFGEVTQSARVDIITLLTCYIKKIVPHQFLSEKLCSQLCQFKINSIAFVYEHLLTIYQLVSLWLGGICCFLLFSFAVLQGKITLSKQTMD